jgi:RimJ/RimL family protein N-acetyltransferase
MNFTEKYKCLIQNKFSIGEYKIIPLRFEDRFDIMNWRNEQMYHLRQDIKLTPKNQDSYFQNEVFPLFSEKRPKQLLFSYLRKGKLIGYGGLVHINWIERTAEVSFIMETSLERDEFDLHWSTYLFLLKKIAFEELKFRSLHTYAYDLRPFLYPTLKNNNFNLKKHLKDEIEIDGRKIDVFIHECINKILLLKIREAKESDTKLIFNWSNDPLVRAQSFHSNTIVFENHENWFKEKLQNDNSLLLINKFDENNIGLVRFELENDKCTVGILIDEKFRGKGFSSLMLINSSTYYFNRFPTPIFAHIKESNTASIRSFEKAGYSFFNKIELNGFSTLVYKLEKI